MRSISTSAFRHYCSWVFARPLLAVHLAPSHLAPRTFAPRTSHLAPRGAYNRHVHRFYAPALDPGDDTVVLPREEAEHLTRVLRLSAGDAVHVFDGRGHEFL